MLIFGIFLVILFAGSLAWNCKWGNTFDKMFDCIWHDPVEDARLHHAERVKEMHAIPSMNENAAREMLAAEMGTDREDLEKYLGLDALATLADIAKKGNKGLLQNILKHAKKNMRA